MKISKLSILVPAYNEEATVAKLLRRVIAAPLQDGIDKEIVLVNDCSTDRTMQEVEGVRPECEAAGISLKTHSQEKNQGKGAAIHKGIELAEGNFLIVQDADLEYDPFEYKLLIQPVLDADADVVYGSRFSGGNAHRILFFWHSKGNKFLTFLSNMFTDLNLTDMETCYKLMRSDIAKKLHLKEKRFGFEPELTAKLSRVEGIRIYEVGVSYYGRTYAEGKKINWKDGFRAIYCILKYNIFSRKTYKN